MECIMDNKISQLIDNLLCKAGASKEEKDFLEFSNTGNSGDINYSSNITMFLLTKQLNDSTSRMEQSNTNLINQLANSSDSIIKSNEQLARIEQKQSNRMYWLTGALVFFTLVQAVGIILDMFTK